MLAKLVSCLAVPCLSTNFEHFVSSDPVLVGKLSGIGFHRTIAWKAKALIALIALGALSLKVTPCSFPFVSPMLSYFLM